MWLEKRDEKRKRREYTKCGRRYRKRERERTQKIGKSERPEQNCERRWTFEMSTELRIDILIQQVHTIPALSPSKTNKNLVCVIELCVVLILFGFSLL